jgi:CoA:oxalate CoA-transferase
VTVQSPVKALEGLRVVDLSRVLAGPFCAMLLADLGAEVIKVESPAGDDSRFFGPFVDGQSAYYRGFNRNKYGVTLDLKTDEGRETLLGGPLRDAPAYDLVAQAMSGIMSVTGWPGGDPTRVGISLGDIVPGLYGALAAVAAVQERQHTNRGQHVDVAMLDSLISVLESVGLRALHEEPEPVATGNDHAMTAPFSTYRTKDGSVAVAVSNDKLFARLAEALDRPAWLADERFAKYADRNAHRAELRAAMEDALGASTTQEAMDRLRLYGVPTAEVLSVREALHQEHARARGVVRREPDGFLTLGSPLRLTGSVPPQPAPLLGQHNDLLTTWLDEPERTGTRH